MTVGEWEKLRKMEGIDKEEVDEVRMEAGDSTNGFSVRLRLSLKNETWRHLSEAWQSWVGRA